MHAGQVQLEEGVRLAQGAQEAHGDQGRREQQPFQRETRRFFIVRSETERALQFLRFLCQFLLPVNVTDEKL